jgi:putative tryptophan/tyrosine transport system substrate-binding protein
MVGVQRRTLIVATIAWPLAHRAACAQPVQKVWRIGVLTTRSRPAVLEADFLAGWISRLRELGYAEGRDFSVEWRFADGDNARLPDLAAQLVLLKPDLIVAAGTPAARALQKATSTVPVVIAGVADPVAFGLVASLARPGGNITGTAIMATDVSIKSLEFLRAFVPDLKLVAVLFNPTNPIGPAALQQVRASALGARVDVAAFEASTPAQIDAAFAGIAKSGAGALVVTPDPLLVNQARQIAALAASRRLPAIYPFRPYVEAGGLMCYGQDIYENYRLAANYIDRIFKGAKPGELPVEQPTKLVLVVNREAATAQGLQIPKAILLRADEVLP